MIRVRLGKVPYSSLIRSWIKNPLNKTLQTLFGGGSGSDERHALQSPEVLRSDNKSLQGLDFSRMWAGSVIICDKLNFEVRS